MSSRDADSQGTSTDGTVAAPPNGRLSKDSIQETLENLTVSAKLTKSRTFSTLRNLRRDAERRLGIEVDVPDPALRELFGHILRVEIALTHLRGQADYLLSGARILAEGDANVDEDGLPRRKTKVEYKGMEGWQLQQVDASLGLEAAPALAGNIAALAQIQQDRAPLRPVTSSLSYPRRYRSASASTGSAIKRLSEKIGESSEVGQVPLVADAVWRTISSSPNACEGQGSVRYHMERRLHDEVYEPIGTQLAKHEDLRKCLLEQQRAKDELANYTKEFAAKKRSKRSSLTNLATAARCDHADAKEHASEEQLRLAQSVVTRLDEEILTKLLDARAAARSVVAQSWAAFARIRIYFFAALAGNWAPVATAMGAVEDGAGRGFSSIGGCKHHVEIPKVSAAGGAVAFMETSESSSLDLAAGSPSTLDCVASSASAAVDHADVFSPFAGDTIGPPNMQYSVENDLVSGPSAAIALSTGEGVDSMQTSFAPTFAGGGTVHLS